VSNGLKQRVVGVLVLASLGLILLPVVFDFADPKRIDRSSLIPPAPEIIAQDIPQATRPAIEENKSSAAKIDDSLLNKEVEEKEKTEKNYGLNKDDLPLEWVLQVGAFAEQSNANEMMGLLRNQGYKAYQRKLKKEGKTLYKVCIGPKLDRRRVLADKVKVDKLLAIDSSVIDLNSDKTCSPRS
jgi:DedD protein